MKHIFSITFLTFTSLLQAEHFDTFVGMQVGVANESYNDDSSDTGIDYGLRLGFIRDTGRVYLSANIANLDNAEFKSASLSFDAITPSKYRFNDAFALRAFIGFHGGYGELDPINFKKDEGLYGGGQTGILLDFPASITFELGVNASWSDIDYGPTKLNNFQTVYLAYDFIF